MSYTIDQIISSVAGESLDYKQYKNDLNRVFKHGGKIIGGAKVPYSKVDTSNTKKYQIRAITTDKGHVSKLSADIRANGIETIPTVEWNEKEQMFEILSGHHRTLAVHKSNTEDNENMTDTTSMIPVLITSFSDNFERELFLQEENNHRPAKGSSKADAIIFLKRIKDNTNHFKSFKGSNLKIEAKRLLEAEYPTIHGRGHAGIIDKVWTNQAEYSQVETYTSNTAKEKVKQLFNHKRKYDSGEWVDEKTCMITSEPNAVGKAVFNACREHLLKRRTCINNEAFIDINTHFPNLDNELQVKLRSESILEEYNKIQENLLLPTNVARIRNLSFLPQILKGETRTLFYVWSDKNLKFVPRTDMSHVVINGDKNA